MIKRALLKLEHNNHLTHLTRVLPLIVAVFGIQCYVLSQMNPHASIGNYAIFLGFTLTLLIGSMVYYDTYHKTYLFEDHLYIEFSLLGTKRIIKYSEIEDIITAKDDASFSSILLRLSDNSKVILHFVDHPRAVKKLIEELKTKETQDLAA